MIVTIILLYSFLTLGWGKPIAHDFVVHERRDSVPNGFAHKGPADASTSLNLRIALKSNDMAGLEKALYEVSDPRSERYGRHLSKEEVEAFVAPTEFAISTVNGWLASHGLTATPITPAGDWISFSVDVQTANKLLDTEFSVYTHQSMGQETIRTLTYSIPSHVQEHVELVYPITTFSEPRTKPPTFESPMLPRNNLKSRDVPASCVRMTPACLTALYGIPDTPATQASNTLGVTGFSRQFAQVDDLENFLKEFRPDMNSSTVFAVESLDGGENLQDASQAGGEANLDTQYTVGVATNVPVTFISVGESNVDGLEGFLDITNFLIASPTPPHVLTTSYIFNETFFTSSLEIKLCDAYMQLGARGVSLLFSSGDGGVAGDASQDCTTFIPTFPSTCPYVTSVGATGGISPEVGLPLSAGGFSNVFPRPSYQEAAVEGYLSQLGSINAGLFNTTGRAFPDISAHGGGSPMITGGQHLFIGGTSVSTPIFASIIALLNDRLIASGMPPLGFLNPLLYSTAASALNDITSGNNPGCGTDGFPAMAGWDPVTGLGTPNFPALLSAVGL